MENPASTAGSTLPQGFVDNMWKPGESGNPLGRKLEVHTLAAFVRRKTLNGEKLIEFLYDVMSGADKVFSKMTDRLYAAQLLLDRGWGKAPQVIEIASDGTSRPVMDLSKLSDEKFKRAKELLEILSEAMGEPQEPKPASTDQPGTTISPQDVPKQGG